MSKTIKSVKDVFIYSILSKGVAFFSSILLTRLLFPEDYGYLVMTTIVTGFISVVLDVGFEYYYIVKVDIKAEDSEKKRVLSTIFMLRIIFNVVLFLLQFFGSYYVAVYFEHEIVGEMLRVLSFMYLFTIFGKINEAILKKQMQFKPIMQRKIAGEVIASFIRVLLAYMGFGAMSFVYGTLVSSMIYGLSLQWYNKFEFEKKYVNLKEIKKIAYFAKHSFVSGAGLFFAQQIDKILLTSSFGANVVGLYNFGYGYAQTAGSYLLGPQINVMFTYIANKQKQPELPTKLKDLMLILIYFATPLFVLIFLYAKPLIVFIFTEKWEGSVELFQIFLLIGYSSFIFFPFSSYLTAVGELKINTQIVLIRAITITLGLFTVIMYSDDIVLYAWTVAIITIFFDSIKFLISAMKSKFDFMLFGIQTMQILFVNSMLLLMIYMIFGSLQVNVGYYILYLLLSYVLLYKYLLSIINYIKSR